MAYSSILVTSAIERHYQRAWSCENMRKRVWKGGQDRQLPTGFGVLEIPPQRQRIMWTYATCGMSAQLDAAPLELHLFSPQQSSSHVELLTAVAHYHLTGEHLGLGHTVSFGRSWLPNSACDYGVISLPYLDGPTLEWGEIEGRQTRFLWLIPITEQEREYKRKFGMDALEQAFESAGFNYLDPNRSSVVRG